MVFGGRRVPLRHPALHGNRAGDGLDHAWELYENAVARGLDDAAFMFSNVRIDQLTTMASKLRNSARFILAHQPAVSRDIGGKNGREPALYPLCAQRSLPEATQASLGSRAMA